MLRPILGLLIIVIGTISILRLTSAFFSDTETSSGNTFTAGELDLKIDNTSSYNDASSSATTWPLDNLPGHLFFNFTDLKPGDRGEDTISLHVQNPAWACMKINITQNSDESCTEPELLDDPGCPDTGDLAQKLNFVFWADDGDNIHQTTEPIIKEGTASAIFNGDTWTLADSGSSVWPTPGPLPANDDRFIGKFWCFGTLSPSVNPPGYACDGSSLNNATQSDKVLADVEFTAVQSRHNPNFRCIPVVTPSVTPTPTQLACFTHYADSVESSSQGTRKNGSAVLATRSNPTWALVPQTTGTAFDPAPADNTFFSLGFKIGQPANGQIVVKFTNPFFNGPGDDLKIFEVTGGPPYPDEKVKVEASPDNITYTQLTASLTKDGTVDLGILPSAQYVRLTDVSDINLFETTADAYDVDGVQALCAPSQ